VTYRIEITRDAVRALAKLDKPVRRRIQHAIDHLQDDPRPPGAVALRGLRGAYRIRVGDYRVIYSVDDGELMVLVVDLGHRREIYRDL
jgi:mRNA interferase RelE/StbE